VKSPLAHDVTWEAPDRPGDFPSYGQSRWNAMGVVSGRFGSGSPGRARTADLVINSRRDSYLCLFYDQYSQDFFCRICGLVLSTEPIPNLSGSVGALWGQTLWSFRMGSSSCPFPVSELQPNCHRSRPLWGRVGQPGPEYPGVQNAREWGTLGSRCGTGGDVCVPTAVVPD
jgi:hypothetical protein